MQTGTVTVLDTPMQSWLRGGHIPSLDGLRGVSILLVTAYHIWPAFEHGRLGVDVFFVVSGFLITHLLLREHEKAARVSLRKFYVRRFLRLAPAYYTYLLVVLMLGAAGVAAKIEVIGWIAALTYTVNLLPHPYPDWLGHAWSLAVEEQFYLLWPSLLVIAGPRRAWVVGLAFLLIAPVLRFVIWENYRHLLDVDALIFTRMDTLAVGCLLAYFVRTAAAERWATRLSPYATALTLAATLTVALSAVVLRQSGKYALGPSRFVEAAAIALIVFLAVVHHRSWVGRTLNWRPLAYIGVLSYSLYLAQPFVNAHSPWPFGPWVSVGMMIGYTFASYYLVERPFLRLKDFWH